VIKIDMIQLILHLVEGTRRRLMEGENYEDNSSYLKSKTSGSKE